MGIYGHAISIANKDAFFFSVSCLYCLSLLLSVFVWKKLLQRTTRINSRLVLLSSAQSLPVASDPCSLNQPV